MTLLVLTLIDFFIRTESVPTVDIRGNNAAKCN